MSENRDPVFLFESPVPTVVIVYPDLAWARESLESLDVAGGGSELAFTATGRVLQVEPSKDLFASWQETDEVELERLRNLLRSVPGPKHLASDPVSYAREWTRLDDREAERPPFVPQRVWSWYRSKISDATSRARDDADRRLRLQVLDDKDGQVRIAFQLSPHEAWSTEELRGRQSGRYLRLASLEDVREWSELESQARAARREWGREGGFAEWTPRRGVRRFRGDLFRVVDD